MDGTGASTPLRVTFLGHSTVLVEMDGVRVLTDPMLRPGIHGVLRWVAPPFAADQARDCDVILISHLHGDHLDLPSLRRIGRGHPIVVPRGARGLLRHRGFRDVRELGVGESLEVGGVRITATPADHSGFRVPFGPRAEAIGFRLDGPTRHVYYAGDTQLFDGMTELADPPLDLALLPVWGWGPNLGPGHLDPRQAAEALARTDARWAVPVHWGGLWLFYLRGERRRFLVDPPREFLGAAEDAGLGERVVIIEPGDAHVFG